MSEQVSTCRSEYETRLLEQYKQEPNELAYPSGGTCIACNKPCRGKQYCKSCYLAGDGRPWSDDELDAIREHYRFQPAAEVARMIGRSDNAVTHRAFALGVKGDRRTHYRGNWNFAIGNPFSTIPVTDTSYVAGIFDGEGDLCLKRGRFWVFGITNTNKTLVDYLCSVFHPHFCVSWTDSRPRSKPIASFRINGNLKVRCLLKSLMPFLTVKRDRAIFAINSIEEMEGDIFEYVGRIAGGNERTC